MNKTSHRALPLLLLAAAASAATTAAISAVPRGDVDWARHGLNAGETRFSDLAQISPATIKRLGIAWTADFDARTLRGVEARRWWWAG
jgi:glucose dehydrogenase